MIDGGVASVQFQSLAESGAETLDAPPYCTKKGRYGSGDYEHEGPGNPKIAAKGREYMYNCRKNQGQKGCGMDIASAGEDEVLVSADTD